MAPEIGIIICVFGFVFNWRTTWFYYSKRRIRKSDYRRYCFFHVVLFYQQYRGKICTAKQNESIHRHVAFYLCTHTNRNIFDLQSQKSFSIIQQRILLPLLEKIGFVAKAEGVNLFLFLKKKLWHVPVAILSSIPERQD